MAYAGQRGKGYGEGASGSADACSVAGGGLPAGTLLRSQRLRAWIGSHDVVLLCLGLVLVGAASLKGHALWLSGGLGGNWSLLDPGSVATLLWVVAELCFGFWLLARLLVRETWIVTLILFSVMALVAASKGFAGKSSCGCFGNLEVSPWRAVAFDVAALVALLCWRPASGGRIDRSSFQAFATVCIAVAVPTALAILIRGANEAVAHAPGVVGSDASGGSAFPNYASILNRRSVDALACGPRALLEVLGAMGVQVDEQEKQRVLKTAAASGTTMLDLKHLAGDFGVYSIGAELSVEELERYSLPAIVHLDKVTFAAVTAYSTRGVEVVWPNGTRIKVSNDRFAERFGNPGRALLFSKVPLSADDLHLRPPRSHVLGGGPRLSSSSTAIGLGRIVRDTWRGQLTLRNDGNRVLRIGEVKGSCSCMKVSVAQSVLAPGKATTLNVEGTQPEPGSFSHTIRITTNQSADRIISIPVSGYRELNVLFDRPAILVEVITGSRRSLDIRLAPALVEDSSDLAAEVSPNGALEVELKARAEGHSIELRWLGADAPGWHRYELTLGRKSDPDQILGTAGITVRVVPRIEAIPGALSISQAELKSGWSRRLTLSLKGDATRAPTVHLAPSPFDQAIDVHMSMIERDRAHVVLRVREPEILAGLGGRLGSLTFAVGGDRCEVPLLIDRNAVGRPEVLF